MMTSALCHPNSGSPSDSYAWHPLSREQKARLSILAREAFAKRHPGSLAGMERRITEFRHEEAIRCCGKRVSEAAQRDYLPLKAHFQDLAGNSGAALNTLMRSESEPRRVALHKLTQECRARQLSMSYPASICKRQFGCDLPQASAKQLWNLVFTVRNRRSRGNLNSGVPTPLAPKGAASQSNQLPPVAGLPPAPRRRSTAECPF